MASGAITGAVTGAMTWFACIDGITTKCKSMLLCLIDCACVVSAVSDCASTMDALIILAFDTCRNWAQ